MKRLLPISILILILAAVAMPLSWSQTYTGSYVDGSNVYHAPTKWSVRKAGYPWTTANVAFSNPSSASVSTRPGTVSVTFSNVSSGPTTYTLDALDNAGTWHSLVWYHDPRDSNLDAAVSSRLATASYTPSGVPVLPFQGNVSYSLTTSGEDVHIVRGNTVSIPYSIGQNFTGYTIWFAAKSAATATTYAIPVRQITSGLTDVSTGTGFINLSSVNTTLTPQKYLAEVQIRKTGTVNTVLKFNLYVDQNVIP